MIIKSIELKNFRNYDSLDIAFDSGTNVLHGDNAQGKTNVLEAAYICATTKSHRGSRDKDMIQFDHEEAHIRSVIDKNNSEYQIDIHLKKGRAKGIAVNKVPIRRAADLFGILNIVFFSPEDLGIITNGPSERRRFMDLELCQLDKVYMSDLTNYNKALEQRNALLKDMVNKPSLRDTLSVWDEKLIEYGKKIISRRRLFVTELCEIIGVIHNKITGGREQLIIKYEPDVDESLFLDKLYRNKEKDFRMCTTSTGPHRDDILFEIDGIDIRTFGSQGQKRTAALSLKLSEIELVKKIIGESPVLLLDDVLSELDSNRQTFLLQSISNIQTIITCTGLDEFVKNNFLIDRKFLVNNAVVECEQ